MPMRALFYTMVAAGIMLLIIVLWAGTMAHIYREVAPATQPLVGTTTMALKNASNIRQIFRGTLILSLLLLGLLLVVGAIATWRARVRHSTESGTRKPTRYVDAWKLAGERMNPPDKLDE